MVATEYALATQLAAWGLTPNAMLGHSLGEYTAACLSGVIDIDQVLPLVSARGRLFARMGGATTSILLPTADVTPLLSGRLVVSGITDASSCTVSGPAAEIGALEQELEIRGVQFQRVRVSMAVHSPELDPVLGEFADILAGVTLRPPRVPYLSNVTGTWIRPEEAIDPGYWIRHSREPVQLAAGFGELAGLPDAVLLEVGPGQTLTRLAQPQGDASFAAFATMRHRDDRRSDRRALLAAVGKAWEYGVDIDWSLFSGGRRPARVELPGYPFERQRYWIAPSDGIQPIASPEATVPVWRSTTPVIPAAELPTARWLVLVGEGRRLVSSPPSSPKQSAPLSICWSRGWHPPRANTSTWSSLAMPTQRGLTAIGTRNWWMPWMSRVQGCRCTCACPTPSMSPGQKSSMPANGSRSARPNGYGVAPKRAPWMWWTWTGLMFER